jgi:F-type H+-transporting ATPase subunit a
MREELSKMIEHLGLKEIATWHIGGFAIQVDPKTIVLSGIACVIVILAALLLRLGLRQPVEDKPSRTQAALDFVMEQIDAYLTSNFSSKDFGARMFPFIATLFLFILASNWLSLLPGLEAPTTDPNLTMGLALMVLVMTHIFLIRARGLRGLGKEYFSPWWLSPIKILSEVVARPLSHGFRLFGNVFAELVLVTVIMSRLDPFVFPIIVRVIFGIGFGLIQAFVFTVLTVVYINLATEQH